MQNLNEVNDFRSLVTYLANKLDWPVNLNKFEDLDELTFEYDPEELGLPPELCCKVREVKQMRPLTDRQPWAVFYLSFESKHLPVTALRRILNAFVEKKRATSGDRATWKMQDLLFVNSHGADENRAMTFAHFTSPETGPTAVMREFMWSPRETHLVHIERYLECLHWPEEGTSQQDWRKKWRSAFVGSKRKAIKDSRELAEEMAHFAYEVRQRVAEVLELTRKRHTDPLQQLYASFQKLLIHDLKEEDFADAYAQTMAYGLFAARAARPEDDFSLITAPDKVPPTNPFLRGLFRQCLGLANVGTRRIDIEELGVRRLVELFTSLQPEDMKRILDEFGSQTGDPVIHFYEDFVKQYDKSLWKGRGVIYTPKPVVCYIVRSVDVLLRTEFGLADGLADIATWGEMANRHKTLTIPEGVEPTDPFVNILDVATGTGTFLVEVIDIIHKTMVAKWQAQGHGERKIEVLWNEYVPKHLLPRLYGYELLMAPYAVAHLKIGLKLIETGYSFMSDERARIYLTNTLEPASGLRQMEIGVNFPALSHEAHGVNHIKRKQLFTVLVGNPPYSGLSANLSEHARQLVGRFKFIDGTKINERGALQLEKNLQDDYIKFLAFAEDRLNDAGTGVCGMICNHGFIDNPTLRGVRWSLLKNFHRIWVIDLHGNVNRGEKTPDGLDDQNVFDIKDAGVAIFLGLKGQRDITKNNQIWKSDVWGDRETHKYPFLRSHNCNSHVWVTVNSEPEYFLFRTLSQFGSDEYNTWAKVTAIFPLHSIGMITARDAYVIDFTPEPIVDRARAFRDSKLDDETACKTLGIPIKKGWNITRARDRIKDLDDLKQHVKPMLYRPFDVRPVFYHESLIWGMAWPVMQHMIGGKNFALITSRMTKGECFAHVLVSNTLSEVILLSSKTSNNAFTFPLYLRSEPSFFQSGVRTNLAPNFMASLAKRLGLKRNKTTDMPEDLTPENIFDYIYAILHSPRYRSRYAEFLKIDFPRLPLTGHLKLFHTMAQLGSELVALHLMESPKLDDFITNFTGPKNPEVGRVGWSDATVWLNASATKKDQPTKPGTIGFCGVPEDVWNFHIGGYQVCHKWLKDRKGRTLSKEDIAHYQKIVVALSETIRIMREIDEVIEEYGGWPSAFQGRE